MQRRVTQAAYARHRGVSRQAVAYAVKIGRIHLGKDGRIDVPSADRAWLANTSPINGGRRAGAGRPRRAAAAVQTSATPSARGPRRRPVAAPPAPAESGAQAPAAVEEPPPANEVHQGLTAAKTTREEWAGKLAELNYRERAGELLERAEVLRGLEDAGRGLRDTLFSIPPRLANVLAAETVPSNVRVRLEEEISQALANFARTLEDLARGAPAEAAS